MKDVKQLKMELLEKLMEEMDEAAVSRIPLKEKMKEAMSSEEPKAVVAVGIEEKEEELPSLEAEAPELEEEDDEIEDSSLIQRLKEMRKKKQMIKE